MSDLAGARDYEEQTLGFVSDLLSQKNGADPQQQIDILVTQLRLVLDAVNGQLSFGDGSQSSRIGNINGQYIQYSFTNVAVVATIPHKLGRKPVGWSVVDTQWAAVGTNPPPAILSCGSNGDPLYGGPDNRISGVQTDWDNRLVYFRLAGANTNWLPALYRIWLF